MISLFARDGHGPDPQIEHVVSEIPDAPLTAGQILTVQQLALMAARAVRDGRSTLVRCHSGYNRSSLVVAQTLIELGHDTTAAIALLRERRSPLALNNQVFEQYLTSGLDVACLLTSLEMPS
ncbi:protein phosphatase [Streptomyces sp. NPDC006393]|uniref:protein-tyrosine phosphatase family protein n=1 Tax=Streptomyces sp. NPDC006393 TaxID=3156763 RepID=UPI0033C1B49F